MKLWRYRTKRDDHLIIPNAFVTKLFEHGKTTEPEAIAFFQSVILPHAKVEKTGIWLVEDEPRMGATPAGVVHEHGRSVPLEVKCPYGEAWVPTALREEKDELQLLVQMAALRAPYGYLFYYISPFNYHLVVKEWNDEHWMNLVLPARVFLRYVERDVPPPRLSKAQLQREINTLLHD